MKFKLCAGVWGYYFFDKDTKKALSPFIGLGQLNGIENEVEIEIPDYLEDNKNVMIKIQRVR